MIENSPLSFKSIFNAFNKFQRSASDHKFRTKSLRIKTVENQMQDHLTKKLGLPVIYSNQSQAKIKTLSFGSKLSPNKAALNHFQKQRVQSFKIIQKNFEKELNNFGVQTQFLKKLFALKCEQTETKYNEQRYQIFVKNLSLRLCKYKNLPVSQMGFGHKSLQYFFEWFTKWEGHITDLDLTYACQILKEEKYPIIKNLLENDEKLMKLVLCNSNLDGQQLKQIFQIINERKHLFALDISNLNSQSLNRVGEQLFILEQFVNKNESVAILKMNNLHLKREGFQYIARGIILRKNNPIKILALNNNHITGSRACQNFYNLAKSGLSYLDLSSNPLGDEFFKNLPILKGITIKQLNLGETNMNSEHLFEFLQRLQQCKTLSVLKLDGNDFSHHWFGKIGEKLQKNTSLQWISLNNCQIRSFVSLFQGLTQNRYIKRLDASNNAIDCEGEMPKRIIQCFTFNKDLQELRIRFCNLNQTILMKIIQGLCKNTKLKVLDISQNTLEDRGGNNILKMLEQNQKIQNIGLEKLQLSQQMKKRIHMKLQENRTLRQREEFEKLKGQTQQMRTKDTFTWNDVEQYEGQQQKLTQILKKLQQKVLKLEDMSVKKRVRLNELIKRHNQEERKLENEVKNRIRVQNERMRQVEKDLNRLAKIQQKLKLDQVEQQKQIRDLQQKIQNVNEKNKKRQNQLQDKLRNHRYLQRKKSKNHNLVSLSPKRYSGHNHFQGKLK